LAIAHLGSLEHLALTTTRLAVLLLALHRRLALEGHRLLLLQACSLGWLLVWHNRSNHRKVLALGRSRLLLGGLRLQQRPL